MAKAKSESLAMDHGREEHCPTWCLYGKPTACDNAGKPRLWQGPARYPGSQVWLCQVKNQETWFCATNQSNNLGVPHLIQHLALAAKPALSVFLTAICKHATCAELNHFRGGRNENRTQGNSMKLTSPVLSSETAFQDTCWNLVLNYIYLICASELLHECHGSASTYVLYAHKMHLMRCALSTICFEGRRCAFHPMQPNPKEALQKPKADPKPTLVH